VRRSFLLIAVVAAFGTTACQRKAEGQTVAVVNGEEITSAELNAELAMANLPPDLDKHEATSRVLQALIDRHLIAQQARNDGLDKSPEYLNRQRRQSDDLLITMLTARQLNTAKLPSPEEVARFQASRPEMFANREIWYLDQLQYVTPSAGPIRARLDSSKTLEQLSKSLSEAGFSFTATKNRIDTSVVPHELYGRIASLPAGEPFIIPTGRRTIASVITSREPAPLVGDTARPIAVAAIRREQGAKFMQDRLGSVRKAAKIEYKTGFAPLTT
jgi:peptidyl-prolyl cis-trans isomerase C